MAEKYYAVRRGSITGIFETWEECRASVSGYPGAEYKSFKTRQEASAYLGDDAVLQPEGTAPFLEEESDGPVKIYVDGSYNSATEEFSYGMVVLARTGEETYSRSFQDQELAAMHNVAGEIKGAEAAMQYALDKGLESIAIYHDYEGIAKWCLGEWKANKEGTKAYKAFYEKASRQVQISFVKVTGHSHDKYNDMADELARGALNSKQVGQEDPEGGSGMKVLLINGSPNEKGCTYTALSEAAGILNECGVETEIVQIGKGPIRGCIGCGGCAGKNRCVFQDDMVNELIEKMEGSDGLIIGSPVYFASPNGNLLSLLDRFFYAGKCFAHKPGAAVVSARRAGTVVSLDDLNKYFTIKQMPVVSSTYWNMVHGFTPDDVRQDAEGLQTMRNLARNMAWMLKCIEIGRENGVNPPQNEHTNMTNFIR